MEHKEKMNLFKLLKVLMILVASLSMAELIMSIGYFNYIPEFGSLIDSNYIMIMRLQFILIGVACSILILIFAWFIDQKLNFSSLIFVLTGGMFAWYRPEIGQYHWDKSVYEFYFFYLISGLLVTIITLFIKKRL
jgi:hypothetical protein